jgi:hypothetical protein
MQWSKLKTRMKALIHPALSQRIDFHITSYRQSHDGVDKIWMTLDGVKFFNCGHYDFERAEWAGYHSGLNQREVAHWLAGQAIYSPNYVVESMRTYLDLSIEDALRSENPFIKALAMIDRRVGRRRIATIELQEAEHPLVKRFHELRLSIVGASSLLLRQQAVYPQSGLADGV